MSGDIDAAIARVTESRLSHIKWRDHLERCETCRTKPPEYVDNIDGQIKIIAEYDNVIEVLAGLLEDK